MHNAMADVTIKCCSFNLYMDFNGLFTEAEKNRRDFVLHFVCMSRALLTLCDWKLIKYEP